MINYINYILFINKYKTSFAFKWQLRYAETETELRIA